MASKKMMIRWDTKCAWNGRQQPVPQKDIDPPKPASLAEGERIRVKFSGRWYNAFVVTSWSKEQKGQCFIVYCSFEFPQPLSYSGYEIY